MRGIPRVFNTKQDWLNAHAYALTAGDEEYKGMLKARLDALKETDTVLVLKDGVTTPPEEQTPDDFEPVQDPGSPLARSGMTVAEIDLLISQLS